HDLVDTLVTDDGEQPVAGGSPLRLSSRTVRLAPLHVLLERLGHAKRRGSLRVEASGEARGQHLPSAYLCRGGGDALGKALLMTADFSRGRFTPSKIELVAPITLVEAANSGGVGARLFVPPSSRAQRGAHPMWWCVAPLASPCRRSSAIRWCASSPAT